MRQPFTRRIYRNSTYWPVGLSLFMRLADKRRFLTSRLPSTPSSLSPSAGSSSGTIERGRPRCFKPTRARARWSCSPPRARESPRHSIADAGNFSPTSSRHALL